ncbi:Plant cysteine oxidase 2 [Linum perenne]
MACLSLAHFGGAAASSGVKPPIRYLHLHECNKFSVSGNFSRIHRLGLRKIYCFETGSHYLRINLWQIGIFCLPPSAVLPLHNHPGMTVFSKLLFGTMHIKSYDWVADVHATLPVGLDTTQEVRLAKVKANSNFTAPCDTSILYPAEGGNMHCFTAVTACAVLDVLGPPYNDAEGRHCQYYFDFPSSAFPVDGLAVAEEEKEGYGWLQERERPEDLVVRGELYRGPPLVK